MCGNIFLNFISHGNSTYIMQLYWEMECYKEKFSTTMFERSKFSNDCYSIPHNYTDTLDYFPVSFILWQSS